MAMSSTANGKGGKYVWPFKVNGNVKRKIRIANGKGTSTGENLRITRLNLSLPEKRVSWGGSTSSCWIGGITNP